MVSLICHPDSENIIKIPYDIVYIYSDKNNTIKYIEKQTAINNNSLFDLVNNV